MNNVLILGATSEIAIALAEVLSANSYTVMLAARDVEKLSPVQSDLQVRFRANVRLLLFDAMDTASHEGFYTNLPLQPDVVVCVFGYLGDQRKAATDWTECNKILTTNYVGAVSILNLVANDFERKGKGCIVGISSVAGERGRQSNYLYGSAKAGFTAYLSGLRNRLAHHKVHVLTVKPGFVNTRMLAGMSTPKLLTASPSRAASDIYKAIRKRRNELYTLWIWRWIMLVIRCIPERIFKKMRL